MSTTIVFTIVCPAAIAFAIAFVATPLVRNLAVRLHALDAPGGRHGHTRDIPRLGGVGLLVAIVGGLTIAEAFGTGPLTLLASLGWPLSWAMLGLATIFVVGLIDDLRGLRPMTKLVGQLVAAGLALAGGYGFDAVTNPFTGGEIALGWFGLVASLGWIVLITNAFNLIDGLDGLAAGVACIACLTIAIVAAIEARPDAMLLAVVLGTALLAFLFFNFHPASIFLGDSGSLLIGYWLALLSMQGLQKGTTLIVVLVPILALGVPLLDTVVTIVRRGFTQGWATIFRGDAEHIHHRLLGLGLNHRAAVITLYAAALALGLVALMAMFTRGAANALLVACVAAATFIAVRKLGYRLRRSRDASTLRCDPPGTDGS